MTTPSPSTRRPAFNRKPPSKRRSTGISDARAETAKLLIHTRLLQVDEAGEYRWAGNQPDRLPALVAELLHLQGNRITGLVQTSPEAGHPGGVGFRRPSRRERLIYSGVPPPPRASRPLRIRRATVNPSCPQWGLRSATEDRSRSRASTIARPRLLQLARPG